MALGNSEGSLSSSHCHHPEPQPNEMALGTELAHPIKEIESFIDGKTLSKAERGRNQTHS